MRPIIARETSLSAMCGRLRVGKDFLHARRLRSNDEWSPVCYGALDPPVGRTFWFQIFIQAPSPEIWRETIFGSEGGCWRGKWGGLFWATSLEKIFGGVIAIIPFRPGGWMQQSAVPRCAILSVGSTGGIGQ